MISSLVKAVWFLALRVPIRIFCFVWGHRYAEYSEYDLVRDVPLRVRECLRGCGFRRRIP